MAKGWEGITSDGKSIQITGKEKMNGYSPSININTEDGINFTETPAAPMGSKDMTGVEPTFPLNFLLGGPTKVPIGVPLQEYLTFLPTAKKALAASLISTGIGVVANQVQKKVAK